MRGGGVCGERWRRRWRFANGCQTGLEAAYLVDEAVLVHELMEYVMGASARRPVGDERQLEYVLEELRAGEGAEQLRRPVLGAYLEQALEVLDAQLQIELIFGRRLLLLLPLSGAQRRVVGRRGGQSGQIGVADLLRVDLTRDEHDHVVLGVVGQVAGELAHGQYDLVLQALLIAAFLAASSSSSCSANHNCGGGGRRSR